MQTTMTHGEDDEEIIVHGDYQPYERGDRDCHGVPMSPPIHASVTVTGAETMDGKPVELDEEGLKWAEEALWDAIDASDDNEQYPVGL